MQETLQGITVEMPVPIGLQADALFERRCMGHLGVVYQLMSFKSYKLLGSPRPAAATCLFLHAFVETFNVHDDTLMYP